MSRETLRQHIERDEFLVRLRVCGISEDSALILFEEIKQACYRGVYLNSALATSLMDRVRDMAARGDSVAQMIEWIRACPPELEWQWKAECIVPSAYPGGPGRIYTR